MATAACMQTLRIAPAAARPRQERGASVRVRAAQEKPAQKWVDGATVAGGGYGGSCEIEVVKKAIADCAGLEGDRLRACWSSHGCDVDFVTAHYTKVLGMPPPEGKK